MDEDLKAAFELLRRENAEAHAETRRHVDQTVTALRRENDEAHAGTRHHVDQTVSALRQENDEAHARTRHHVDQTVSALRQENDEAHARTRHHVEQTVTALRQENDEAHSRTRHYVDQTVTALRHENNEAHATTRRHFEVVAERLESKFELVAEGVGACNDRIDRVDAKIDDLDETMKAEFGNVRSMIKFSHHDLDRRLRSLEDTVSDLQSRVERLEGTH